MPGGTEGFVPTWKTREGRMGWTPGTVPRGRNENTGGAQGRDGAPDLETRNTKSGRAGKRRAPDRRAAAVDQMDVGVPRGTCSRAGWPTLTSPTGARSTRSLNRRV